LRDFVFDITLLLIPRTLRTTYLLSSFLIHSLILHPFTIAYFFIHYSIIYSCTFPFLQVTLITSIVMSIGYTHKVCSPFFILLSIYLSIFTFLPSLPFMLLIYVLLLFSSYICSNPLLGVLFYKCMGDSIKHKQTNTNKL